MRTQVLKWCFGLTILAVATCLVGLWQWKARQAMQAWDPDHAREAGEAIPVRTVKADTKEQQETIGGTAVSMPFQTATIVIPLNSSSVHDRAVTEVVVRPGSTVKHGDLLFKFEPVLFQQLEKQRQAVIGKARQSLDALTQLNAKNAASALQVTEAKVALETAQLEHDLAKADLDLCVVKSPLDGIVETVNVVPQMRVGSDTVLAVIHQLDPLLVQMDYPMERLDSLRLGQKTEVVLDAFPQETFSGVVTRILPVVSTKTRVLPVIIQVSNPQNRIKAGISGFARIKAEKRSGTTVPTVAVINRERKAMVFCVENNRARIREVRTGPLINTGQVEILSGLRTGDEVIIYGQDTVKENDLVNVNWREWTGRE
jgi:membrane fusion protein, multidrug efflux system